MKNDIQNAIKSCEERIRLYEKTISKKTSQGRNRLRHSVYLENVKIAALRAQEEAEKNEPLTLDELRQMDGEPVWIVSGNDSALKYMVDTSNPCQIIRELKHGWMTVLDTDDYGKTWLAYRRQPKEDAENGL